MILGLSKLHNKNLNHNIPFKRGVANFLQILVENGGQISNIMMSKIKETISIILYLKSFGRLVCQPAGQPIWPFQVSKTINHLASYTASLSVSHTARCLVYLFVSKSIGLCLFLYVSLFVCWVYLSWLLCYWTNFQEPYVLKYFE